MPVAVSRGENGVVFIGDPAATGSTIIHIDSDPPVLVTASPGDEFEAGPCASVTLRVLAGTVEVTLQHPRTSAEEIRVRIPTGAIVIIERTADDLFSVTVDGDSVQSVGITDGGDALEVAPGATVLVPMARVFTNAVTGGNFAVWDGATMRVETAIVGFEDRTLIVWSWAGSRWIFYSPSVPARFNTNFRLTPGSILWVVARR